MVGANPDQLAFEMVNGVTTLVEGIGRFDVEPDVLYCFAQQDLLGDRLEYPGVLFLSGQRC
ncbi:MAG: hypothetical protein QNL12_05815 [Acidimicrobiia bacterium]|nr:hypothetical protein [Acidimicrobiia bacterium]